MDPREIAAMGRLEDTHWYFRGKRRIIERILTRDIPGGTSRRILDVGCGTGGTLAMLRSVGHVFGADASPEALAFCRNRGLTTIAVADGRGLPFRSGSFDVVCAFDVLEHLDDERLLIDEIRRVLKPGGVLLVTVPAFEFLWSEHDVAVHHVRRYTAGTLRRLLDREGFDVKRLSYFNTLLLPVAFVVRLMRRAPADRPARSDFFTTLPGWLNDVLAGCFGFEARFLRWVSLPVGLSVLCTAHRVEKGERL